MLSRFATQTYKLSYALVPIVGFLIYYSGVGGIFLLDDFPSLAGLGSIKGGVLDGEFWAYVLGGSGFPGRPLALFSFAIQHSCWPDDAGCFQLVNVSIHALNGLLVAILGRELFLKLCPDKALYAGFVLGLVWILAPINVSSVLYSVQRMNLLSATFVLLGLIFTALYSRLSLDEACRNNRNLFCYLGALYACIALSVLSKENGILLSLFAFTSLVLLYEKQDREGGQSHKAAIIGAILPIVLFGIYLAYSLNSMLEGYDARSFTLSERLTTELVVLYDYIALALFPKVSELGLFHDDYEIISNLFNSWKAIFTLCLVLASVVWWAVRPKSIPAWGLLFFFIGHLLESTFIPLELYFEHRNYIPSIGLYVAVISMFIILFERINARFLRAATMFLFCGGMLAWTAITHAVVTQWSNPFSQAQQWYIEHPSSLRALGHFASIVYNVMGAEQAEILAVEHFGNQGDVTALLFARDYNCEALDVAWDESVIEASLQNVNFNYGILVTLETMISKKKEGKCEGISFSMLNEWLEALSKNDNFNAKRLELAILKSRLALAQGSFRESAESLLTASRDSDRLDLLVGAAQSAVMAREFDLAEQLLKVVGIRCEKFTKQCLKLESSIEMVRKKLKESTN